MDDPIRLLQHQLQAHEGDRSRMDPEVVLAFWLICVALATVAAVAVETGRRLLS